MESDIFASKILDWYSSDFDPSLREYLRKHVAPEMRPHITDKVKIRFRDYNWDLAK
jgi:hypothetical protein